MTSRLRPIRALKTKFVLIREQPNIVWARSDARLTYVRTTRSINYLSDARTTAFIVCTIRNTTGRGFGSSVMPCVEGYATSVSLFTVAGRQYATSVSLFTVAGRQRESLDSVHRRCMLYLIDYKAMRDKYREFR